MENKTNFFDKLYFIRYIKIKKVFIKLIMKTFSFNKDFNIYLPNIYPTDIANTLFLLTSAPASVLGLILERPKPYCSLNKILL